MISSRKQFIELVQKDIVPPENIAEALRTTGVLPDGMAWRGFIDRLLLWLGGLALAFAAMYFIAYNWDALGRFVKFGMAEGAMILFIAAFCLVADRSAAARVSLLAAAICLGVLLALYGQTYQTGADPWQLFFTWAALMLPWAVIGKFAGIWILWTAILNITIILYCRTFPEAFGFLPGSRSAMIWLIFFFNSLVLTVWEIVGQIRGRPAERWAVRLPAFIAAAALIVLVLQAIFNPGNSGWITVMVWVVWLGVVYFVYRKTMPDLFMLVCACLSAIIVVVGFLAYHMPDEFYQPGFLLLALVVVGMGAGAGFWLKNVNRELQS